MTKTRVINLTAHEAAAFQRGATMLVMECKPQPRPPAGVTIMPHALDNGRFGFFDDDRDYVCPFGKPGDLLIGREAWGYRGQSVAIGHPLRVFDIAYKADGSRWSFRLYPDEAYGLPGQRLRNDDEPYEAYDQYLNEFWDMWLSAARMPQWAARVRRIVESVSLNRCQELTEGEIEAAGYDFREHNAKLWAENRFVWVTSVKEET